MIAYTETFFFAFFPYVAVVVAVVGCVTRLRNLPLTWKSGSSQLLESKILKIGSILFHIGMINLLMGHLFGLLTPPALYHGVFGLDTAAKQKIEMAMGFLMTPPALLGTLILIWRRLVDERVRAASSWGDLVLLGALAGQLLLGFLTIPQSAKHMDGSVMAEITAYTRGLASFNPDAASHLRGVHWVYKLHIFFGFCFVIALPFTRLVHVLSGLTLVRYVVRPWQVVRKSPRS